MKKGFTLAEVLITLTIIGVIAALTIPNLMQSYKKYQVEVGVKEAYSILSNAIKMSEAENGPVTEWNWALSMDNIADIYLFPYLKVAKKCGNTNNAGKACWKGVNQDSTYPSIGYSPTGPAMDLVWFQGNKNYFILANGMSVITKHDLVWGPIYGIAFYVDINGPNKGPSVVGNDIHMFSLNGLPLQNQSPSAGTAYMQPAANFTAGGINEEGNYQNATKTQRAVANIFLKSPNDLLNICNNTNPSNSYNYLNYCTAVIQQNGWKIPDDYPVKKW